MSTYRLNLTIDEEFSKILAFFKSKSPLLSDVEIIKMIIGEKYVEKKQNSLDSWIDTLPELVLSDDQNNDLNDRIDQFNKSKKTSFSNANDLIEHLNS
jgi:hypothetical protein